MKFSASQNALYSAISTVATVVPSKSPMPVLTHIMAKVDGNVLLLSATDLEVSLETKLEIKGMKNGQALFPARKLLELIRDWPDVMLTVEASEKDRVFVTDADGKRYELACESAANYPKVPSLEGGPWLKFDRGRLRKMISKTVFAVSRDELRPQLTGVYFQATADMLRLVSTDGHRLVKVSAATAFGEAKDCIVPRKAMDILARICEREGEVEIAFAQNQVGFRVGNTTLITKLIEGKYPNYEAVIPQTNDKTLRMETSQFHAAVRRAATVSNEISHQIRLKLEPEELMIQVEDAEQGNEGQEKIPCTFDGEPMEIGYNAGYVLDMLKQIEDDEVVFHLGGPTSAGIVKPAEQDKDLDLLMLIMPVRLN